MTWDKINSQTWFSSQVSDKRTATLYCRTSLRDARCNSHVCSLTGLARFQSIWHDISSAMAMVSKRAQLSDPETASRIKNRTLVDLFQDLRTAARRLENLIIDVR